MGHYSAPRMGHKGHSSAPHGTILLLLLKLTRTLKWPEMFGKCSDMCVELAEMFVELSEMFVDLSCLFV